MDSVTQGLLGAALAECGLRGRLGRGATVLGAVGGVLPDADFALAWINPWWAWEYHRHFTHGFLFAPLAALPLAWLFWRRHGRTSYGLWFLCAYVAIATHPLLDICTTYGTHLLWPFSDARLGLDWIAIVDPFYSLILVATLILCWAVRKRAQLSTMRPREGCEDNGSLDHSEWNPPLPIDGSPNTCTAHPTVPPDATDRSTERGPARSPSQTAVGGRTWAIGLIGMVLSTGYLLYGASHHHRALKRIYDHPASPGERILMARAIPQIGSVYVWRLIYRTDNGWYVGRTNTRFDHDPVFTFLTVEDHPLIRRAEQEPRVQFFHRFTMDCARPSVLKTPKGWCVLYDDMRYSWKSDGITSLWSVAVDFDRDRQVTDVRRVSHAHRGPLKNLATSLWDEVNRP